MNFNFFILGLILISISSCGVKSPPLIPPGSEIPSYDSEFLKESAWESTENETNE